MGNKGYSSRNLTGGYTHYDSHGHKTGHSSPNLFGGYTNYDAKGHKTGHSSPNLFGGYTDYDSHGHKTGHSNPNLTGGYTHYDARGHKTSTSYSTFTGGYSHNSSSGGCYIATCVYGSYDCPEVWTLRRFRDYRLMRSVPGRMFVRTYYKISPVIVRLFGSRNWFRKPWKHFLDNMVQKLRADGYDDTRYYD